MFSLKKFALLSLTFAMLVNSLAQFAAAGHGYRAPSRGGSSNWRGAVNSALQGARHIQNHQPRHHHQPRQQHHAPVQPTYRSARPTYTPAPQHRVHIQPAMPHRQPAPRMHVIPQVRVAPPTYVAPRTNATPHTAHAPQTNIVPRVNSFPVAPTHVRPQSNVVPQVSRVPAAPTQVTPRSNPVPQSVTNVAPVPNVLPATPAPSTSPANPQQRRYPDLGLGASEARGGAGPNPTPEVLAPANPGPGNFVADLTQADIDRMVGQINDRDLNELDQAQQAVMDNVDGAIDNLPNADQLTDADRQALRDAIANGNPDAVRDLLGDMADTPAGQELIDMATAIDAIDDVRDAINGDNFGGDDIANFVNTVQNIDFGDDIQQQLLDVAGQIAVDQQVVDWLGNTDPGVGDVPFGGDTPIVLVPGLPEGMMMPLADGPVMIGAGDATEEIMLGTGNPAEVAGLPVAMPGEEPAAAASGPIAAGQIILANPAAETVNYNLNQQPQQMEPDFEQTLPGETSWIVEFDRGGNFGQARYQLSEGYYYFKATEQGWELVRKTFKTTLDNAGNKFAFNYVIDGKQQTINPGETHDLTGPFPPVLRFDNGKGEEQSRKLDSGSYKVALADGMKLDIYKSESVSAPQSVDSAKIAATTASDTPTAIPAPKRANAKAEKTSATERSRGQSLPEGFTLFNPVKALTEAPAARRLPKSFTLFRSAATQLQTSTTN